MYDIGTTIQVIEQDRSLVIINVDQEQGEYTMVDLGNDDNVFKRVPHHQVEDALRDGKITINGGKAKQNFKMTRVKFV